jgi:hypothetical protein
MIWILLGLILLIAAVALARWILTALGEHDLAVQGLAYAAGVVVAAQALAAAISIDSTGNGGFDHDRTKVIMSILADALDTIAWEAGLLVAAAILLARRRRVA